MLKVLGFTSTVILHCLFSFNVGLLDFQFLLGRQGLIYQLWRSGFLPTICRKQMFLGEFLSGNTGGAGKTGLHFFENLIFAFFLFVIWLPRAWIVYLKRKSIIIYIERVSSQVSRRTDWVKTLPSRVQFSVRALFVIDVKSFEELLDLK